MEIIVTVSEKVNWSVFQKGGLLMGPSSISLNLEGEGFLGINASVKEVTKQQENFLINTPVYKKSQVLKYPWPPVEAGQHI